MPPPGTGAGGGAGERAPASPGAHRLPWASGVATAKSVLGRAKDHSPWVLTPAVILVAFAVAWFAGILLSFRHAPGLSGRERVQQFFEPASFSWAVAVLVALVLWVLGRRLDPPPAHKSRVGDLLPAGLFLAAAAVVVSAAIDALVELTAFGNGIDAAFSGLISYLAVLGIGAATAWWAFKEITKPSP
jgi:hypothetical protein